MSTIEGLYNDGDFLTVETHEFADPWSAIDSVIRRGFHVHVDRAFSNPIDFGYVATFDGFEFVLRRCGTHYHWLSSWRQPFSDVDSPCKSSVM